MVEGGGLENRCRLVAYLGFESLVHRHYFKSRVVIDSSSAFKIALGIKAKTSGNLLDNKSLTP